MGLHHCKSKEIILNCLSFQAIIELNSAPAEHVEGAVQEEDEVTCTSQIPQTSFPKHSAAKKPTLMEIEIERLDLDRERMKVDKEHLEVFKQISGSLQEISQNFQVFLHACVVNLNSPAESEL